jgi:hypothetical protein
VAHAQAQYQPPPYNPAQPYNPAEPQQVRPYNQTQPYGGRTIPPSWNYDPYTDGTVPTPRGGSG